MALITCPDCTREVSDQAPTCPGCGRPMAQVLPKIEKEIDRRAVGGTLVAIGSVAVVGGLLVTIATRMMEIGLWVMGFGFVTFIMGRLRQD